MSWQRIRGVLLHNLYDSRHSPVRTIELIYWPILWLVLWGFITEFLVRVDTDLPGGIGVLLGALVLWELTFRSSIEVSWAFLIDVWDRNILNVHASPLRPIEHFIGSLLFALARVLVAVTLLVLLAWVFFDFNLFDAGRVLPLAALALVGMGWALGVFIRATILRFGSNAEIVAWSLPFLVMPMAAVFYPVDVLPGWLQGVAALVPASHVFEALRTFLQTGDALTGRLLLALALDAVYLTLGALVTLRVYRTVRIKGLLGRPGY